MKETLSTPDKPRTRKPRNARDTLPGPQSQSPPPGSPSPAMSQTGQSPDERHERIALVAYYKAQRRGFNSSGELEDWLAAEREIDEGREPLPTPGEDEAR